MHPRRRVLAFLLVTACGRTGLFPLGESDADAGAARDAGVRPDSGVRPDAGVRLDAGVDHLCLPSCDIASGVGERVNCLYQPNCILRAEDTTSDLAPRGTQGRGFLQSRTSNPGAPGTPAAGLIPYRYRIEQRNVVPGPASGCFVELRVPFGRITLLDYDGDGDDEALYFDRQGIGDVAPTFAYRDGDELVVEFAGGVCPGQSSYFVGLTSPDSDRFVTATVIENGGRRHTVRARAAAP